ncbi:hypothetical protein F5Y08DRAFT_297848 [Xylaria arbuscula]|nr:hypothetical protein F5Y08DRAFT_297848 [Xylaria arbuscula]
MQHAYRSVLSLLQVAIVASCQSVRLVQLTIAYCTGGLLYAFTNSACLPQLPEPHGNLHIKSVGNDSGSVVKARVVGSTNCPMHLAKTDNPSL